MKKKAIYPLLIIAVAVFTGSCERDFLETKPTTKVSGDGMFATASAAMVPLNGIYRMMYEQGWSTEGNTQQCDGLSAWNLMADVMGEDMVMKAQGSGWYWYDCTYGVKSRYTSNVWRPYDLWNGYYKLIANANYIIAAGGPMEGSPDQVAYVVGQAYAIRAYCSHYLAMLFSRTYKGHESEPCVPVYTEPSVAGSAGKPRATNEEVYKQITADIDTAIVLLKTAPAQKHPTHIDYAVANGIKARICLTTNDWEGAAEAAKAARSNCAVGKGADLTGGMNSTKLPNVMWGAEIIDTQTPGWGPFLYHLDALSMLALDPPTSVYAARAPKCINSLLYDKLGANDIRRQWWQPGNTQLVDGNGNVMSNYIQVKFRFSDPVKSLGDKIWMRVEEMYLTEAEALCRSGQDAEARKLLNELIVTRNPDYNTTKSGTALGALTTDETGSLLEEILIQRRIELWGEYGRIYDIKRLKQGFTRTAAMGWPAAALINATNTQDPETYAWVLTIPQAEFDGNASLDPNKDQNPVGDYK
ncbi:MAG: RagB/SusD family nutrient uptake outer membrane protein [Dysgonamonadaceae bacterium]|jgi:hypothetical protein|nr:RagB/SusD family nutrient uptake outer membrane protein [Dysgonamonadaceae bacterium]